jgi:DNA-binding SARP family transcriptional activator
VAVLAYLLGNRLPPNRRKLAEILFGEADDPLGALRWSLAQLRGALGHSEALRGDPVELALPPGVAVDVTALRSARPHDAQAIERLCAPLLEGMSFPGCPAFELWLTVERRQLAAAAEALLLERAQAELAADRPDVAARFAGRLVELSPLEEAHQELAVRCLLATGDSAAAQARVDAFEAQSVRELGFVAASAAGAIEPERLAVPGDADGAERGAHAGELGDRAQRRRVGDPIATASPPAKTTGASPPMRPGSPNERELVRIAQE